MTFNEFLEKHPEEIKKAKACETIDEFKKLVDDLGISYNGDAELKQAYNFVKGEGSELSDEDIETVAGGRDNSGNTCIFSGGK